MIRLIAIVVIVLAGCGEQPRVPVRFVAASSLTDVLPEVADASGAEVMFDFGSSSRLAVQIVEGAPADGFVSADTRWMDHVAARIDPATRVDLLGHVLVVAVPASAGAPPARPADLAALARIGVAGESVPAGRYADAALAHAGVAERLAPRLVRGDDVRTVLAWIAGGEVDAGVVYRTDALAEPRVRIAFALPAASHPPIVYPAAAIRDSARHNGAAAFLRFCRGERARAIFERAGFRVLP